MAKAPGTENCTAWRRKELSREKRRNKWKKATAVGEEKKAKEVWP